MIFSAQRGGPESWASFLRRESALVRACGLPPLVLESREHWVDFLRHGYLERFHDPGDFIVEELREDQYRALKQLVAAYFRAGFEFLVPIALRPPDYTEIAGEFATLRDHRKED